MAVYIIFARSIHLRKCGCSFDFIVLPYIDSRWWFRARLFPHGSGGLVD